MGLILAVKSEGTQRKRKVPQRLGWHDRNVVSQSMDASMRIGDRDTSAESVRAGCCPYMRHRRHMKCAT